MVLVERINTSYIKAENMTLLYRYRKTA